MSTSPSGAASLHHHLRQMEGRDLHERHRVATPLELLFDLTFAASFGVAASRFADALGTANYGAALLGFGLAALVICWAWVNFSWFASAYDIDDWVFAPLHQRAVKQGSVIQANGAKVKWRHGSCCGRRSAGHLLTPDRI